MSSFRKKFRLREESAWHLRHHKAWAAKRALKTFYAVMALHQGLAIISQIKNTKTYGKEQKIKKVLALANAVIATNQSIYRAFI